MDVNENIQSLEVLSFCAMRMSGTTQGRGPVSWSTMMESLAFGRLAINGLSVLRLTLGSSCCTPVQGIQAWDLASVSSLSRNLIETYLTLHYFAQENCTASELELRKKVWQFHATFERLKMLRSALPQSGRLSELRQIFERRRQELEQHALFHVLPKQKRRRVLNGEVAKVLNNEELAASANVSTNYYASLFKYGSNHTHSSPFSFAQLDSFNAGDETSRQVFRMALKVSTAFLAVGIRDHLRLWSDQANSLSAQEKHLVSLWEGIVKWDKYRHP